MTSLRFREDGSFRVLQMADVQDGPDVLPDTIRLIREAIQRSRSGSCGVHRRPDPRLCIPPTSTRSCAAAAKSRALACARSPRSRPNPRDQASPRNPAKHPIAWPIVSPEAGKPVPAALLDPDTVTNAVAAAGADSTDVITTSEVGDSVETSPAPETVSTLVYSTQSRQGQPPHTRRRRPSTNS